MTVAKKNQFTANWSRRKLWLYSIFFLVIIFVLLEIVFRIGFFFTYHNLHTTTSIQGSPLKTSDAALVWKNQPFYTDYQRKFQYNEQGMKSAVGDEFIPVKTGNDYWVLLTGASAMEGMGSNRNGDWLDITGIEDYAHTATIGYYLQQLLQQGMPLKKVKVFNAACSGYVAYQSYRRWQQLAGQINPDWVVSMDGCNERALPGNNQSIQQIQETDWATSPQFHFPLNFIVALTTHSAFVNAFKQALFHTRQSWRMKGNLQQHFPVRSKWLHTNVPAVRYNVLPGQLQPAVDSFKRVMYDYDSALTAAGKKHLLLVQPYMSLRDTTQLTDSEKAVNHYYRAVYNDGNKNSFMQMLHLLFANPAAARKNIVSMDAVHHWKEEVFVDYCHFTDTANRKIAAEISRYILSDGKEPVFSH